MVLPSFGLSELDDVVFSLEVDLFASPSWQLVKFFSKTNSPQAVATDALMSNWDFQRAYAFPPIPLILLLLNRFLLH